MEGAARRNRGDEGGGMSEEIEVVPRKIIPEACIPKQSLIQHSAFKINTISQ